MLRHVNLHVRPGELVGLMGPNGMGKSTLLRIAAGMLWPLSGHVEVGGRRRRQTPEDELAIRRTVAYLPDHPWLPRRATGREFLVAVGQIYEVPNERLFDHVERLFDLFDLSDQADMPIRSYSNGQRKKIAICSVLVSEAPVLILDEPFAGGLDPAGILALKHLLKRLAARTDVTVLMATPVPELVEQVAHRIAVLVDGELVACDTPVALRRKTRCDGPLQDVLGEMIHPDTAASVDRYFEGR